MKPFLFITDFDGTITAQDFFLQIMYRYQHDRIFSKDKKRGVELLSSVLEEVDLTKEQFLEEIKYIPMDKTFIDFYRFFKKIGGDILVLSAGSKYYIEKKLKLEGIEDILICANGGNFEDGSFKFYTNKDERFFCPVFGVDKKKVISIYKEKYEKIFYAGDSYVDFDACRIADFRFAKKNLVDILKKFKLKFYEFENFDDIRKKINNLVNF